jgi:hypothetical protein
LTKKHNHKKQKDMPETNYEELTLQELIDIINTNEDQTEEAAQAFEELRVRASIMAIGGDRPTVPPRNP